MAQKILNNIYLWKIYLSCIHNRVYIFLYEKNLLKKKKKKNYFGWFFFFFFLYFFIYFLFFLFIYSLFFTRITISTFEFFNAARFLFFFSEIGNSDVILVIYIYNALLGLVFLSFIKLFSLYIHWLFFFNRRRNLVFRLSMLHFRFEEGSDVSVRISSFDFVAGRTEENTRRVSEPWIRYLKL